MSMTYIEAISKGFPTVQVECVGDGSVYDTLVWVAGSPMPSKATLDEWIAANPDTDGLILTHYAFRQLFTFAERVAIDNAPDNLNIPENYRQMVKTMTKDLELAQEINLGFEDVKNGINMLEQIGLLSPGRSNQILTNTKI